MVRTSKGTVEKVGLLFKKLLNPVFLLSALFYFKHIRKILLYQLVPNLLLWVTSFIVALAIIISLYLLSSFTFKEKDKAVLVTSFLLLNILFYQIGENISYHIINYTGILFLKPHGKLFYFALISIGLLIIIFIKNYKFLRILSNYVTLFLAAFLLYDVAQVIFQLSKKDLIKLKTQEVITINNHSGRPVTKPDIYYLILDGYTSRKSLQEDWHFDNSELYDFLEKNKFYIAENASSNYNITITSLASSLNLSYLSIPTNYRLSNADLKVLKGYVNKNEVVKNLQTQGYEIYSYTTLDFNNKKNPQGPFKFEFSYGGFFENTILKNISGKIEDKYFVNDPLIKKGYKYNKQSFSFINDNLENVKSSQPKFYFVHFLTTHWPYVFDKNNKEERNLAKRFNDEHYPRHVSVLNNYLKNIVQTIIRHSANPPVIIIQGDHGMHHQDLNKTFSIINAYYFPDKDYAQLYPHISPVNSFRVIFNKYFNTNMPLLPDQTYNCFYGETGLKL